MAGKKRSEWFKMRDRNLMFMGISSWDEYLGSDLFKRIKLKVMKRAGQVCEVCGKNKATEVYHRSYYSAALHGSALVYLTACCASCLKEIRFEKGKEVSPKQANARLHVIVFRNKQSLPGMCRICRTCATGKHKDICGNCERRMD